MLKRFKIGIIGVVLIVLAGVVIALLLSRSTSNPQSASETTIPAPDSSREVSEVASEDSILVKTVDELVKTDQDLDGWSDEEEKKQGTSPSEADSDHDGLTDKDEGEVHKTNPRKSDTDGDGFLDGYEVKRGSSPTDAKLFPPSGAL